MGSISIEFENWRYVCCRTAFGWKWATRIFSPFAKAIKMKVRKLEINGFEPTVHDRDWVRLMVRSKIRERLLVDLEVLGKDLQTGSPCLKTGSIFLPSVQELRDRWRMAISCMYVDDLLAGVGSSPKKARRLVDGIRAIGHLLLGHQCWSFSKAEEEGVFSHLQKFTGEVFNTKLSAEPRASFTVNRLETALQIVRHVTENVLATECGDVDLYAAGS